MPQCSGSRGADPETLPPTDPVDREIALVRRQHEIRADILREHDERGIGEIHRAIRISIHETARTPQRIGRRWNEQRASGENKIETGDRAAPDSPQQMGRLGQDRFGRDDLACPRIEEIREFAMPMLAAVQQ